MIKIGDKIPSISVTILSAGKPVSVACDDFFSGARVVLFGLPGAFTPTCSKGHLPGFVRLADAIFAKGVNKIVCLSVNDSFVMSTWGQEHKVGDKVIMLADGSARLTQALGLVLDLTDKDFGVRSQRYAMVVNDGTVEQLWVEEGGEFKVSSAEYVLERL